MVAHSWLEWMGGWGRHQGAILEAFPFCLVDIGEVLMLDFQGNQQSRDPYQLLDAGPSLHHHYPWDLLREKVETSFEVLLQEMNMDWVYPGACIEMETQMDLQVQGSQMDWDLGSWLEFSLEWRA